MKCKYRGFEIDVHRAESMGGDLLVYYSIFRESDLFEATSGFSDSADHVMAWIGFMKERIDNELKEDDPWNEKGTLS